MHANIDLDYLSKVLSDQLGETLIIKDVRPIGGGSISSTYRISSTNKAFFLKVNRSRNAEAMFKAEVNGLELLRKFSTFSIPEVITVSRNEYNSFLIMELIVSSIKTKDYWQDLAIKLAELHRQRNSHFGLEEDNFIGSLPQNNSFEADWAAFFINQRIAPMTKMAFDNNLIENRERSALESALINITDLMPKEPQALLHGDLWSGNLLTDGTGEPCLIDPAVYFGHREMDIAFSKLFGGFKHKFYECYQDMYPMEPGFNQRRDLYNLYPLLVHLNLFGRSYIGQINSIISRFT
jgi:fructosamine-3-kinase